MKTIYDMQPDSKLIATSSVSVTTARESGIGRFSVIQVPLLSFYEYCELLEIEKPVLPRDLNVTSLLSKSQHERNQIMLRLSKVTPYFFRYLQIGGFPELACADNDWIAQQIVREDVVDKVLKRDIPALYPIRYPLELQRLFLYLCNVSSQLVSIEAIFKELQSISRPTIEKYISYLESANLIYQSWPICIPGKPVLKVRSKIYIADAAIRNAIHMNDAILTDPDEMERIVETAVFRHVAAFYSSQATAIGYYQGCGKNKDVAVEYPDRKNILIEVRYRKNVETEQEDEIYKLSGDAPSAIVVTKNLSDFGIQNTASGGESLCIPVAAFLYVLGHAEKNGYQRYQI
jgi:predicted AAA+ superfamily ATPase